MRIIQLIDSLEAGGAEKMAVNYANAISNKGEFSGLVATRKEGNLKSQIDSRVNYLFLNRKRIVDIGAFLQLRNYCLKNNINFVQAHSSSFFIAITLKIMLPKLKIIWHDHYGMGDFLHERKAAAYKIGSYFFAGIISVNSRLKEWAKREMNCDNIIYLPNFILDIGLEKKETFLHGVDGKRILCLANLRAQKNHFLLIELAKKLKLAYPDWSFHLIGKDFEDEYSASVKRLVEENGLQNTVFVYGAKNDVQNIIKQSDIGILTSQSEGLPVALLEYGLNKKPVVVTAVGEISQIINNGINGFIVNKDDIDSFSNSLLTLIENKSLRLEMGEALKQTIQENHSEEVIINKLMNWLE